MLNIYKYILSVSLSALTCSIIKSITGKNSSYSTIVNLLCGVFIAVTVISPLIDFKFPELKLSVSDVTGEAAEIAEQSGEMADSEFRKIIIEQTEAYILDKAAELNADVSVEITLAKEEPIPRAIVITGDVAPYNKSVLSQYLADTIGISEDAQIWK